MELLQLRYFFESANNESFVKTAEKYRVPATSVSAAVKRLEKELGCALFHRTCNRIMLNDNGKRFLESMRIVFAELDQAVLGLSATNADTREIKILVRAMRGEITDRIIEYKTKHPHIAFKTVFDFTEKDFENYDIIIDEESDRYPQYEKFKLYTTRIRLRAAAGHPLCGKKLTLQQLSHESFVSIGEQNGLHGMLVRACKKAGFTPNIIVQSNDLTCCSKCIEAGVGIGLAREYPNQKLPDTQKILNVVDFNETQTVCSYYKKQSAYGNVEHFLNFLKSKTI